ncbi:hypothetical protein H6F90_02665 [Trichocoleus sp. FACHB-591]|uniref:hypothetical protein n=1 Tax=Trichocoleus sp. FACHB-591 TaxID=2692872 RepID=UPI00168894C8|nr:hypothetical protein [Trichocoleus sp. FACHB-591]MBD2094057.1 hypothetical protein [Trichocoleus sp. FACHB-591]
MKTKKSNGSVPVLAAIGAITILGVVAVISQSEDDWRLSAQFQENKGVFIEKTKPVQ